MTPSRRRLTLLLLVLSPLVVGCPTNAPPARSTESDGRGVQRRAAQANVLLKAVASQLRSLPEATQLELRPPVVLLDARTSANGEDVLATLTAAPESPRGSPANVLTVPRGNARFRAIEMRPGDIVKYFIDFDRETRERIREQGEADIINLQAVNLTVAQTLDDNTALIVGGLTLPVTEPAKIEVWRNVDDQMDAISDRFGRYAERRDPPLAWQPSPDRGALEQVTERLNQWLRQRGEQAKAARSADDAAKVALASLPENLAGSDQLATFLATKELDSGPFREYESRLIQQAVWARDLGLWARGDSPGTLDQATRLFDWTVRNLQLLPDDAFAPRFVWEAMLYGRATAAQRAWVFTELCRQQGLAAAALVIPTGDDGFRTLAAVAIDDAWRVFDPELGLPMPGDAPDTIATLSELQSDDGAARRLDLEGELYPHSAPDFESAVVAIVADPFALTERAAALEDALAGGDGLTLGVEYQQTAERYAAIAGTGETRLWALPFETLLGKLTIPETRSNRARRREIRRFIPLAWRPRLWKGRTLHFRGRLLEADASDDPLADDQDDHRDARRLYVDPRVRPTSKQLARVGSDAKREIYQSAKALATLWLGTLAFDEGDYENARQWLERGLADPTSTDHRDGARYNLARTLEALGETDRAADLLEADTSPQRVGNRLRAARLRAATASAAP